MQQDIVIATEHAVNAKNQRKSQGGRDMYLLPGCFIDA